MFQENDKDGENKEIIRDGDVKLGKSLSWKRELVMSSNI